MQNIVKTLVEVDRQARQQVADRQSAYEGLRDEMAREREELTGKIQAHAQRRMEKMHAQAQAEIDEQCAALQARYETARAALQENFARHRQALVQEIVQGCLQERD